jgi:hypothetical protein
MILAPPLKHARPGSVPPRRRQENLLFFCSRPQRQPYPLAADDAGRHEQVPLRVADPQEQHDSAFSDCSNKKARSGAVDPGDFLIEAPEHHAYNTEDCQSVFKKIMSRQRFWIQ